MKGDEWLSSCSGQTAQSCVFLNKIVWGKDWEPVSNAFISGSNSSWKSRIFGIPAWPLKPAAQHCSCRDISMEVESLALCLAGQRWSEELVLWMGLKSCLCSKQRSIIARASPALPACVCCGSSLQHLFNDIWHRATGGLESFTESSGDYFLLKKMWWEAVSWAQYLCAQHVAHGEQNSRVKCILLAMNWGSAWKNPLSIWHVKCIISPFRKEAVKGTGLMNCAY